MIKIEYNWIQLEKKWTKITIGEKTEQKMNKTKQNWSNNELKRTSNCCMYHKYITISAKKKNIVDFFDTTFTIFQINCKSSIQEIFFS